MEGYYYLFYTFVIYSFLGWSLEVVYHLVIEKKFINRGFLHGPLCPIYGSTAVLLIIVLKPVSKNLIIIFIGGAIAASILEIITGYLLEVLFNAKWWDYSKERLNIKGYICLKYSVCWGILSIFFIRLINPEISKLTYLIMDKFGEVLYNIILVVLIVDIALTVNSLIVFRRLFIDLQEVLVETKGIMDELLEKTLSNEAIKHIQLRISYLGDLKERLARRVSLRHKALLRAYPHITSKRFGNAIDEIKKRFEKHKH